MSRWMFVKRSSIAAPFVPTDLADLRCWLDASDSGTITLSGSSVTLWEDKAESNDADDAVNSSNNKITTARPTRVAAVQNGLDAINFNGSQWFDHNTARGMLRNRSCAIGAWVGKYGSVSNNQFQGIWTNANSNNSRRMYFNHRSANTMALFSARTSTEQNKFADTSTNPPYNTDWHVHVGLLDWANGNFEYRIDGSQIGTDTYDSSGNTDDTDLATASNAFTAIGSEGRTGLTSLSSGSRIGEMLCWAKNDIAANSYTTAEVQKVEGYLAWKWGLQANLPDGHPYENAPPTA